MSKAKFFSILIGLSIISLISLSSFSSSNIYIPTFTTQQDFLLSSSSENNLSISDVLHSISFPTSLPKSNISTQPITIAVIDSGINKSTLNNYWVNTKEIPNNGIDDDHNGFVDDYYGWDFVRNQPGQFQGNFSNHGTFISHIIYSMTQNVSNIKIMDVRVLDTDNKNNNFDSFYKAINYALLFPDVKVIQFSIEFLQSLFPINSDQVKWTFTKAFLRNIPIITVSGNNGKNQISDPGNWSETISVASVEKNSDQWTRASYSNYGPNIDISAPGSNIQSIGSTGHPLVLSGTSFSSAFVGGGVALFQSLYAGRNYTVETIRHHIQESSLNLHSCSEFGAGLFNLSEFIIEGNQISIPNNSLVCNPTYSIPYTLGPFPISHGLTSPNFSLMSILTLIIIRWGIRKLKRTN